MMTAQNSDQKIDLYLDLLKKSLTGTLFKKEPELNPENEQRFFLEFTQHYIRGDCVSMLPLARLDNVRFCVEDVLKSNIPGDFIETGVWRGGATIFMRAILKAYEIADRVVWVADSFEGLPEPDADRFPLEAKTHAGPVMKKAYNHFAASLEEVQRNFKAFGLLDDQVRFLKGWFKDTLPAAPIELLSIMRLDGDYYESTMDGLVSLYDKLSPGGYVIIDDYGEDSWTYCRKAVDTFRGQRGIKDPLIKVDPKCYYWQKSA
jgi:hypothetical protein